MPTINTLFVLISLLPVCFYMIMRGKKALSVLSWVKISIFLILTTAAAFPVGGGNDHLIYFLI